MLLVPQDMMELLPQHKFSVRLMGIGQLLQDAHSCIKGKHVTLRCIQIIKRILNYLTILINIMIFFQLSLYINS